MASDNLQNSKAPSLRSNRRHKIMKGLQVALFSAISSNYSKSVNGDRSLPFATEQLKSKIECCLREFLPSLHTPTHLSYASMIQSAIVELGEIDGSSEESISEFMKKEYEDLPWAHEAFLRLHLGKLCESGELMKSKCGRYKFKIEDEGVGRKELQGETAERSQPQIVQSKDEFEDLDENTHLQNRVVVVGLAAKPKLTTKGSEKQSGSLIDEIDGVEGDQTRGGQIEVLDKLKEVREDEMIEEHHEVEAYSRDGVEDFDRKRQSQNAEEILIVKVAEEQCGSLREEIERVEGDHAHGLAGSCIMYSRKSEPHRFHHLGRPRKLNVDETSVVPFPSSVQSCNQVVELDDEDKEPSIPETGGNTHHIDQQQHQNLARGRGRGRGQGRGQGQGRIIPQIVKQDQISTSEALSPSMHLHHQQSSQVRGIGRPRKRKFDADVLLKDNLEQQKSKPRRGRPPKVLY